jgi:hypothetical protein
MRKLLAVLIATLFPVFACAQEAKPVQLADYVSFCLAVWAGAPDIQAKASALGLQDGFGSTGARIAIGQLSLQFYKAAQGNQTVGVTTTTFADGKDLSCDVNLSIAVNRTDLETMEQILHLDGQIITLGAAVIGRWKMPDLQPPVLLKVIVGRGVVAFVQQFEATAKDATQLR